MNKIKLLTFSIVGLLLLNIGMICYIVFGNKIHKKRMPKEIIIEKLHFDQQQIIIFETLITSHRNKIKTLNNAINYTKNELYRLLNNDNVDANRKDSLITIISKQQNQIENVHFNHYKEIKNICKKEQVADFKKLTTELTEIFAKKQKHRND